MKFMDYICDCCELITVELLDRIEEAKAHCESLGVGVYSDELATHILKRKPLRPYVERARIISSIKNIDFVFKVNDENNIVVNNEEFYYNNTSPKKYKIGYAPGTYDLLHQGHLEHLSEAASQCEILVVGINDDELVYSYKHKNPYMPTKIRAEIISKLRIVDAVFIANTLERGAANEWIIQKFEHPIDAVFIGSDWMNKDLHNPENFKIIFTDRDPEKMKTRSSTYYRDQISKLS